MIPGTEQTRPTPPSADFYDRLTAFTVPAHSHDNGPETGLLVACILIWVILIALCINAYCMKKKAEHAVITMRA